MTVELISVGTEILMGNIINTNAAYLSEQCAGLGISLYNQVTVGDNPDRLEEAIKTALNRSDTIILTGGLGPTKDDLTKEIAARALGKRLIRDFHTEERIASFFRERKITDIAPNNWKQADVIEGAIVLDNPNGTAPGEIAFDDQGKTIILLPGPPNEMIPLFQQGVFPYLKAQTNQTFYSKMVKVCGVGESRAEIQLLDLIDNQTNPTIAPYAKTCEVHFRITARGETMEAGEALVNPVVEELYKRFGDNIYTTEESVTLEQHVITLLKEKQMTITTGESITGGAIAAALVNVPGASEVFGEGYITYSNEAKIKNLLVKKETLEQYGAVSEETAREMAEGACKVSGSNASLVVTGIAGPTGETPEKPIGLVYIGCCVNGVTTIKRCHFNGNRQKIRDCTVVTALDLLRRNLW